MARRCGPTRSHCGMSQGLYNPFFQNGAYWYGAGGSAAQASTLYGFSVNSTTGFLSWTTITGATSYILQRSSESSFLNPTTIFSALGTFYQDSAGLNDVLYYRVKAVVPDATINFSNTVTLSYGVTSALFWLRGDNLTLSGSEVTTWPDKSSSNNALTLPTRNTPNRLAAQINGQTVVDFTASGAEVLRIPAINNITTFTCYIVFKADVITGTQVLLSQSQNGSGSFINFGWNILLGTNQITVTARTGTGQQTQTVSFTDIASYHVLMVKFQSNGASTSRLLVKVDGVNAGEQNILASMAANNQPILIGAPETTSGQNFDGKMAEVMFFTDYHSNAQQNAIHSYLKDRYAFSFTFADDDVTITQSITYPSSIDSITNLFARISYREAYANQPICIIMHGWSQNALDFLDSTIQRFKGYGCFTMALGLRGRNSASGARDASAREMYDIYDAIQYAITNYPTAASSTRANIVGWSGGGGNAQAGASKFPDLFVLCVSFFGLSDYGYDPSIGWYQYATTEQAGLASSIGGNPGAAPNEYKSRQHTWSASNTKGKLRLYHDVGDTTVLPNQSQATVAQLIADGFTNYTYSESQIGDPNRWIHGLPNVGFTGQENIPAEAQFSAEFASLPVPVLPTSGTLKVNGFVHTKLFVVKLRTSGTSANDGQSGRATLVYNYINNTYQVTPSIDSPATTLTVSILVVTGPNAGKTASGSISSQTTFMPT